MATIDIILAVFLVYFAYKGFSSGFIVSVATLIGLVLGLYAAAHFSEFTAGWLQSDMGMKSSNLRLIAYVITFVLVVLLVFILGRFLTGVVKTVGLGIVNRLAGALLGILKGVLIASFIFMLINRVDPRSALLSQQQKDESLLYKPVCNIAPVVIPVLKKYTGKVKDMISHPDEKSSTNQAADPSI
jgi:membrane protein required for colicin V production